MIITKAKIYLEEQMNRRRFMKAIGLASVCGSLSVCLSQISKKPARQPNILWINSEDNSISWVGCYGSPNAKTPHIDQLAREGFCYTHCFANAAVCAPMRSTWITGLHAISMGTQPMRSRYDIPHDQISYYPERLAEAGYFTGNIGKTDYNIGGRPDNDCWRKGGGPGRSWDQRKPGQPFFVFKTLGMSHESRAMRTHKDAVKAVVDPGKKLLHPYHPDLPEVRETYARYAEAMRLMDEDFGALIEKLKAVGLYDDTIIIYCSDHGGVLPRSKRFLYSSGIHCPLIIRIPEKWKKLWPAEKPGMTVDRMVSFVDMPKTVLSFAGARIPKSYQGSIFLDENIEPEPAYHLSYRGRADKSVDMVRCIRGKRYAYIKNYMPWAPNGQFLSYMWALPATMAWEQHYVEGKCDETTGRFFRPRKSEEFYDNDTDFHNVDNLIDSPAHQEIIDELRQALRQQQLEIFDSGLLPEAMRMRRAAANNLTVYEMVRNPDLYPLEKYLNYSDRVLARDPKHLPVFVEDLKDKDEGIRYWAVCGLFLLEDRAMPAKEQIKAVLEDEADEVKLMAAWALDRLGEQGVARALIEKLKEERAGLERPDLKDMYYSCSLENWIKGVLPYVKR